MPTAWFIRAAVVAPVIVGRVVPVIATLHAKAAVRLDAPGIVDTAVMEVAANLNRSL